MYINELSERTHKSLIIKKKFKKYSLTCPNSIGLLMDSPQKKKIMDFLEWHVQVFYKLLHQIQPYLSKFNCFINGLSGMTRASFLQIARPNTDLKPVWFTPISILSSHISFLVSQTEFLCLSHTGVSIWVSVSGSCRVKVGVFD